MKATTKRDLSSLTVAIDEAWRKDAIGIIHPVPPDTAHQKYIGCIQEQFGAHISSTTGQSAFVLDESFCEAGAIQYILETGRFSPAVSHFFEGSPKHIPFEEAVENLLSEANIELTHNRREKLEKSMSFLASRFLYDSAYDEDFEPPPLACDIREGNCLDINTALTSLLSRLQIPNAYYIGYFFEGTSVPAHGDWHCWVSTALNRKTQQDWDIAHHLKRRINPILPGLNPAGGSRIAMSTGRNIEFALPGKGSLRISHLGLPRWLMEDGRTREARVKVRLQRLSVDEMEFTEKKVG